MVSRQEEKKRRAVFTLVSSASIYRVPDTGGAYWAWNGQTLTWSQWQAAGNDVDGREFAA